MILFGNKLLSKTLRVYLIFSTTVLIIFAPLFYFSVEKIYTQEADKSLLTRKKEFDYYSLPKLKVNEIPMWNKVKTYSKILNPSTTLSRDTIFTANTFDTLEDAYIPCRFIQSPIQIEGQHFIFSTRINLVERTELIENIALLFAIILLFLLTGLYFITKKFSNELWQPFYVALKYIKQFELNKNPSEELMKTDTEEFETLNQSVINLVKRNKEIYEDQLDFIDNAAYEIQTPISTLKKEIQELSTQTILTEQQNQIIERIKKSYEKLAKLSSNLLLLSLIETDEYRIFSKVNLNELIENNVELLSNLAKSKNVRVTLDLSEIIEINSNHILMDKLIYNLLSNAVEHNVEGGNVFVALFRDSITIFNTGVAKPLAQNKLFKKFSKVNPSSPGNGLGLVVISKIGEVNDWKITYSHQNNQHIFKVKFL
jgi:signal transduction histidine kinase